MKKFLAILLALTMVLALAACGAKTVAVRTGTCASIGLAVPAARNGKG